MTCATPMNGTIQCETFGLLEKFGSKYLSFYGITATPSGMSFDLFPQLPDGRSWLNTTFTDSTYGSLSYKLYNGDNTGDYGFRIRNATCFAALMDAFGRVSNETIILANNQQRDIIGGILII